MVWATILAGAAGAALAVTTFIVIRRTKELSRAQSQLSEAKDRQLQTELKAKDAEIAHAQEAAAKAEEKAANALVEYARLQKLVAWRSLTRAQQAALAGALRKFKGQRIEVLLSPNDPEVDSLAEQILLSMNWAEWQPSALVGTASGSRAVHGIAIDVAPSSSDTTQRSAEALAEALRKDGLEVQGPLSFDFRVYGLALTGGMQDQHATMRMTIGRKR